MQISAFDSIKRLKYSNDTSGYDVRPVKEISILVRVPSKIARQEETSESLIKHRVKLRRSVGLLNYSHFTHLQTHHDSIMVTVSIETVTTKKQDLIPYLHHY